MKYFFINDFFFNKKLIIYIKKSYKKFGFIRNNIFLKFLFSTKKEINKNY